METVRIEHITTSGSVVGTDAVALANGDAMVGDCGDDPSVSTAMNGQLEIEIPAGDARQGAIHTIQLQSPGGNTHIVEGLVVTSATGPGGEVIEGETTLFQGPGGTFLLPTTNHHNNNLAMVTSPNTCEVISADNAEHHILSGLQVVRVTTGDNGETIFLVPATGHDKDGVPQVMVLQSAEDITEETHQVPEEMVEESVELNIPSPKPVLTTVKQEAGMITANGDEGIQHYTPNTLVVVTGGSNGTTTVTAAEATSPPPPDPLAQDPPQQEVVEQKPVLTTVNGHQTATVTPTTTTAGGPARLGGQARLGGPARLPNGALLPPPATVSADDRPKRKAAIKAVATRKAALASVHSPRKSNPKSPKAKAKVEVTPIQPPKPAPAPHPPTPNHSKNSKNSQVLSIVSTSSSSGNTLTNLPGPHHPPPPPIVIQPPPPPVHRVTPGGARNASQGYFLLPEDIVSDSEDEGDGTPIRKCVVCLRRRRFTADIYDNNAETHGFNKQQQLSPHIDILIAHLNIPIKGKSSEVGICPSCLDSLQRWHVFNCTIVKRHECARSSGAAFDDTPLNCEAYETRIYRNYRKMSKVKEVYRGATHAYLARRSLTEKDWDFFCENLFRFNSVRSERARELEKYIMCREKLTHIYCVKCQRLVKNGRKGFVKHMKSQHPHETILFPCDICGNHFPEKDVNANSEEYYAHWIAHFYFNTCEECGKRFPTKRSLGQHRHSMHKNRVSQWNMKGHNAGSHNEDRPWKCDQCDASFKMKGALMSHRDVVHYNLKNHVCNMCGEAFKSASSLRGHVRRHEGRRDYKCEVCNKEYYTYSALKGHKVVHQTARDFICGICGKAFKKKKALEEHGTLHTGVKPHRCPICGREIRVKSNLYKHMKIHKKNAELGITSGRGRHHLNSSNSNSPSSSVTSTPTKTAQTKKASATSTAVVNSVIKIETEPPKPKIKQIKVEDRILEVKQEPGSMMGSHSFHVSNSISSAGSSSSTSRSNVHSGGTMTTSPIQGSTAVDVVLENASELGAAPTEHRGPIVVSIVTDGLGGGPGNILQMDPEQQAQLLSAVTSLATSQGQTVTVAASRTSSGTTFIASPIQTSTATAASSATTSTSSSSNSAQQDPILGVSNTQYYTNTQQFFTSLDQLQN